MRSIPTVIRQYHHGDLYQALLDAGLAQLAALGHSDISLSELARSVGVTPAAAYKHFAHKAAMLGALAERGFMQLTQEFECAAPRTEPAQSARGAKARLERLAQAYLDFGAAQPALFQLMFGQASTAYRAVSARGSTPSPSFSFLLRALEDLYLHGVIKRSPEASDLWTAWVIVHGATHLQIAGVALEMTPKDTARAVAQAVIASLK